MGFVLVTLQCFLHAKRSAQRTDALGFMGNLYIRILGYARFGAVQAGIEPTMTGAGDMHCAVSEANCCTACVTK